MMPSSKSTFAELRKRWIMADAAIFWALAIGVALNVLSATASLSLFLFAHGARIRPMHIGMTWAFCLLVGFTFGIGLPCLALYYGTRIMRWRAILAMGLCLSPCVLGAILVLLIKEFRQLEFPP
jgi:hypothetical protein